MISTFVETFIGVQAKDGKGDDVEAALNAYRDRLVGDTMQYPMNIAKIQASPGCAPWRLYFLCYAGCSQ